MSLSFDVMDVYDVCVVSSQGASGVSGDVAFACFQSIFSREEGQSLEEQYEGRCSRAEE
jgi:hypothetical protein